MGVGIWLDESWGKRIVWVFKMDGWMGVAGWAGGCQEQEEMPGWVSSVGGWMEGCVDTAQGCCGDNQKVWVPQGSPSTPWWAHGDSKGVKNPLLGVSRGQDNFSSMQCGSPGVG